MFVCSRRATGFVIIINERQKFSFRWGILHYEDRDVNLIGTFHPGYNQLSVNRVDQQRVGLLGYGVEHLCDLQVWVALAVDNLHHKTGLSRFLLDPVNHGDLVLELLAEGDVTDSLTAGARFGAHGRPRNGKRCSEYRYA